MRILLGPRGRPTRAPGVPGVGGKRDHFSDQACAGDGRGLARRPDDDLSTAECGGRRQRGQANGRRFSARARCAAAASAPWCLYLAFEEEERQAGSAFLNVSAKESSVAYPPPLGVARKRLARTSESSSATARKLGSVVPGCQAASRPTNGRPRLGLITARVDLLP